MKPQSFVWKLTTWLLLFVACQGARAEGVSQRYWLLDEYKQRFPEQAALMAEFDAEVVAPASPALVVPERPVKIAVVYPGNQISDYWRRNVRAFEGRLNELRVPYRIFGYFTKPGVELRRQEQQIVEALREDPDYLVFTLDVERHNRLIERIIARGRPKLILQNITTPVRAWNERQPFFYVGFDHVEGTRLLVESLLAQERPPQSASVIFRKPGYVSEMRGGTFIRLADRAGLPVRTRFYTESDRASARKAAEAALLEDPDLDFIFASSTDLAFGIMDALKAAGRERDVAVNGWGGGSEELNAIRRGDLHSTVMRINDDGGAAMAEAIKRDLQGLPVPQVYSGRFKVIKRSTDEQTLKYCQEKAFRYSGYSGEAH